MVVAVVKNKTDKQSPISHFGTKIKSWKPGQSGNPKGRPPKSLTLTSLLKDKLDKVNPLTGQTYAQGIVDAMFKGALCNPQILKELLERCEGKVTENVDMRTTGVQILYELVKPNAIK